MIYENINIIKRLSKPSEKINIVIDTDAFNEIDDQYAISYALKKNNKINVEAIYAAPFFNRQAENVKDGMEKSYNEVHKLLTILKREDLKKNVFRGSENYLIDEKTPQMSDVVIDLIERAKAIKTGEVLYVMAIGAITNIASAILLYPEIKEKIVLVWLGGHSHHWSNTREFNMYQDVSATRVVFDSGVPLVQIPCMGVASHLSISRLELCEYMNGKNEIGSYLYNITDNIASRRGKKNWSRIIWDLSAIMWLAGPENCMTDHIANSPIVSYDGYYSFDYTRHFIKVVDYINRDAVFEEFFSVINSD